MLDLSRNPQTCDRLFPSFGSPPFNKKRKTIFESRPSMTSTRKKEMNHNKHSFSAPRKVGQLFVLHFLPLWSSSSGLYCTEGAMHTYKWQTKWLHTSNPIHNKAVDLWLRKIHGQDCSIPFPGTSSCNKETQFSRSPSSFAICIASFLGPTQ